MPNLKDSDEGNESSNDEDSDDDDDDGIEESVTEKKYVSLPPSLEYEDSHKRIMGNDEQNPRTLRSMSTR